jgi:hypothetical protein
VTQNQIKELVFNLKTGRGRKIMGLNKPLQKPNLLIVFLLAVLCFSLISALQPTIVPSASALVTSSKIIGSQGSIDYGPSTITLKYETDFENIVKVDPHYLSLPILHRFTFADGYGNVWMEGLDRNSGITPHSGSRCVGMELTELDLSGGPRNEFNIVGLNSLVGQELFVSVWLYLPANWGLFDPNWNWYSIADPMFEQSSTYLPYWVIFIVNPPSYNIYIATRGLDGQLVTMAQTPPGSVVRDPPAYPLPLGRWFNLQYYVKHSSGSGVADGAVKIWIDGKVVCELSNVVTSGGDDWFTTPAKIYGSLVQSGMPYKIWVDDLEIYGLP